MSDFYTVLKQSIVDRNLRSAAAREEVYAQARTAMIRQLWSYDPPLAEDEIDGRIGQFDTAVERIERDFVVTFAGAPPRAGKPERAPPARPQPIPVIEGYDEEADYAPAFGGRPEPSPAEDGEAEDRTRYDLAPPVFRPLTQDRESAIEAALRDEPRDGEEPAGPVEAEPAYARYGGADDGDEEERAEERQAYADERRADDDGYDDRRESDRDEDGTAPDDEPSPYSHGRRVADVARALGADGNRVRILVAAIGALAVVLIAIGAYVLVPLVTSGDDPSAGGEMSIERLISDAASAERIAAEPADIVQSFTLFDGQDPTVFDAVPDNPVRFEKGEETGLARISSSASAAGARVIVGPGLANRLAGRNIRVTLVARAAPIDGAGGMRFAYQSGVAISHWQRADLKPDYTAYGLTWRVPSLRTDPNGDYLIIEPGIPGDGTSVEIESIKIDLLAAS
jgi:hypothetical protein